MRLRKVYICRCSDHAKGSTYCLRELTLTDVETRERANSIRVGVKKYSPVCARTIRDSKKWTQATGNDHQEIHLVCSEATTTHASTITDVRFRHRVSSWKGKVPCRHTQPSLPATNRWGKRVYIYQGRWIYKHDPVFTDRWGETPWNTTGNDENLQILRDVILQGWPEKVTLVPEQAKHYFNIRDELSVQNGIFFRGERAVIPISLRSDVRAKIHSSHIGIEGCLRRAREIVYGQVWTQRYGTTSKGVTCVGHLTINSLKKRLCHTKYPTDHGLN